MKTQTVVRLHLRAAALREEQRRWRTLAERLGSQDGLTAAEREQLRIALQNIRALALALRQLRRTKHGSHPDHQA